MGHYTDSHDRSVRLNNARFIRNKADEFLRTAVGPYWFSSS